MKGKTKHFSICRSENVIWLHRHKWKLWFYRWPDAQVKTKQQIICQHSNEALMKLTSSQHFSCELIINLYSTSNDGNDIAGDDNVQQFFFFFCSFFFLRFIFAFQFKLRLQMRERMYSVPCTQLNYFTYVLQSLKIYIHRMCFVSFRFISFCFISCLCMCR